MTDPACNWDASTFSATAIHTGENRKVSVNGSGTCPTAGWSHALEADNPGINPNPAELVLRIRSTPPGGIVPQVLTDAVVQRDFDVRQDVSVVVLRALNLRLEIQEPA